MGSKIIEEELNDPRYDLPLEEFLVLYEDEHQSDGLPENLNDVSDKESVNLEPPGSAWNDDSTEMDTDFH